TASDIHNPKNGACITAENKREASNVSKFGAVAATVLLMTNTIINPMSSGFEGNLIVIIRSSGPKIATLIAYALNKSPVVATSTFRSDANCVNKPVTTYSVIPIANVPSINTNKTHFRENFNCI